MADTLTDRHRYGVKGGCFDLPLMDDDSNDGTRPKALGSIAKVLAQRGRL
jgi:hypothetical protein